MTMDLYEKNMDSLKEVDPPIAAWIDSGRVDGKYRIIQGNGNPPNLEVFPIQGDPFRLYPVPDPVSSVRASLKGQEFVEQDFSCLIGFGLGYLARAICEGMEPGHKVLVIEPENALLKTAFRYADFSEWIKRQALIFVRPEPAKIQSKIGEMTQKFLSGKMRVVMESYCHALSREYEDFRKEVEIAGDLRTISLNTVTFGKSHFLSNMLMNIRHILHSSSINQTKDLFTGMPAILISAGPSLHKNIHLLHKTKERAVTIALAQTLRTLLAYGFEPDLVVSSDAKPLNLRHVRGLVDVTSAPLIYTSGLFHPMTTLFQKKRLYAPTPDEMIKWLSRYCDFGNPLPKGTSAGYTAFCAARRMGCDPIVFVGQDLSFGERVYLNGYAIDYDPRKGSMKRVVTVKGIKGGEVSTSPQYRVQKTLLEAEIRRTEAECINATEGGAHIEGTRVMPLEGVIFRYCNHRHSIRGRLREACRPVSVNWAGLLHDLEKKRREMAQIHGLSLEGIQLNAELYEGFILKGNLDKETILQKAARNIEITRQIDELEEAKNQLSAFSLGEHRLIASREMNPQGTGEEYRRMETTLQRNRIFLEAMKTGSQIFLKSLDNLLPALRGYVPIRGRGEGKASLTLYRLGYALARQGLYREALAGFLEAYRRGKKDVRTCYRIAYCYRQMEYYRQAIKWYKRVVSKSPHYRNATRCLKCLEGHPSRLARLSKEYLRESRHADAVFTGMKWQRLSPQSDEARRVVEEGRRAFKAEISS